MKLRLELIINKGVILYTENGMQIIKILGGK